MGSLQDFRHSALALVAVLVFLVQCQGIRLNPNGGYDIVVGIEDTVVEPQNAKKLVNDIKVGMEQFSSELWKATNRRFFINSVDILVPGRWWTIPDYETLPATWQTLLGSEIRISQDVGAPNAVNPNSCGTPGLYIETPHDFFDQPGLHAHFGKFGPVGKSMVNMWARYRFGVWEEHGIPGDAHFPYFHVHPSFEPKWEATGCSNEKLTGSFRTIDGEESGRCDPYSVDGPDDDCRFIPSEANTANSSLMHIHWLDSVTEFCDTKTHNYAAPNRQNLFCGHRSIWEVIRESDDYKSTTSCLDNIDPPEFRILKENKSPEFYVLLDRGRTVTPEKVLQEVMGALAKFVSYPTLERVNIAIGTYPHSNQGKTHHYVKEEVGWAPVSAVYTDIERILNASSVPDGPVIRDFGLAIQEVAEEIKQRNHLAGTIILVVKRGASPNLFDKLSFEQEVIASVKEDSKIQVFAIETQQGEQTPYTNLQSLVEATTGKYHLINDTMNTAKKLEKILAAIQEKLEQSSIMNSLSSWTIQKGYTEPHTSIEIPIHDSVNRVKIHLTTNGQLISSDIYLEQLDGEPRTPTETQKGEWDENSDLSRRLVFTYTIDSPSPGSVWTLKHGCHSEQLAECRFFLVVVAHNDRPTPRIGQEFLFSSQSISIDVSTSASESSRVDMSEQALRIVPFAIYAKIEMEQQRVLQLQNVTALVRRGDDTGAEDWVIPLADDGSGTPDIAEHDGIYSGTFTPLQDGLYQISVAASGISIPGGSAFQNIRIVNHAGSLMQVDQLSFGCKNSSKPRCASAVPRGSFSRVQDLPQSVFVENSGTFKPGKPTRILDFKVSAFPNFKLEFEFTSPKLLGSEEDPEEFRIYMAPHVDNFIGSTDMTQLLITERGAPSGTLVNIPFNAASQAIVFYAVEAVYGGQKSGPSNVVGIVPSEQGALIPSPTTTPSPILSTVAPTSAPTTTTEYPWPTTTPTTPSPFSTTTEESEEAWNSLDEPTTQVPIIFEVENEITFSSFPSTTTTATPFTSTTTSGDGEEIQLITSVTKAFTTSTLSPITESDFFSTTTSAIPNLTAYELESSAEATAAPEISAEVFSTDDAFIFGAVTSTTEVPAITTEGEITGADTITTSEKPPLPPTTETDESSSTISPETVNPSFFTNVEEILVSVTTTETPSTTEREGVTDTNILTTQAPTTTENSEKVFLTSTTPITVTETTGSMSTTQTSDIFTLENDVTTSTTEVPNPIIILLDQNLGTTTTALPAMQETIESAVSSETLFSTTENSESMPTFTTTATPMHMMTDHSVSTTEVVTSTTESDASTTMSTTTVVPMSMMTDIGTSTTEVTTSTTTTESSESTSTTTVVPMSMTTDIVGISSTEDTISTTESSSTSTTTTASAVTEDGEIASTSTTTTENLVSTFIHDILTTVAPILVTTEYNKFASTSTTTEMVELENDDTTTTNSPASTSTEGTTTTTQQTLETSPFPYLVSTTTEDNRVAPPIPMTEEEEASAPSIPSSAANADAPTLLTTPEPPIPHLSVSEQASTHSTPITEPISTASASFKLTSSMSHTLISLLTFYAIYIKILI